MKRCAILLAVLLTIGSVVRGQKAEPPKPGPEHQKLAAFVGNWTFEGEMKPGPMGPGGKMTGTDKIQWLPGNFFVERRFEGKGPMGEMKGIEIIGYDAAKKTHTYNWFDNMGMKGAGTMTLTGNTWKVQGTADMGGQTMHDRCDLTLSDNSTTLMMKCEMSQDGKTWTPSFEGKAKKGM